jgi:hypothetical protein
MPGHPPSPGPLIAAATALVGDRAGENERVAWLAGRRPGRAP